MWRKLLLWRKNRVEISDLEAEIQRFKLEMIAHVKQLHTKHYDTHKDFEALQETLFTRIRDENKKTVAIVRAIVESLMDEIKDIKKTKQ